MVGGGGSMRLWYARGHTTMATTRSVSSPHLVQMSGVLLWLSLSQPLVWEEEELCCGGETRQDGDQELLLSHTRGLGKDG